MNFDEEKISVSNIPVSFLEPFERNEYLTGDELIFVSQPVYSNIDTSVSGYISRSLFYDTLVKNISADLDISSIRNLIYELKEDIAVDRGLNYLKRSDGSPYPYYTVISALAENNRGQIVDVSGYILSNSLSNILYNVTLPKIQATNSPWILSSNIVSVLGDSTIKVASQYLVTDLWNRYSNFVYLSDVVSEIGTSTTKVASQYLVNAVSSIVNSTYIKTSQVKNQLGQSTTDVPTLALVNGISASMQADYIPLSNLVSEFGQNEDKAASQYLVTQISNIVYNNYLKNDSMDNLIPVSNIMSVLGNNTDKPASQSLVRDVSAAISSAVDTLNYMFIGQTDQVVYLTPTGYMNKQSIMNLDVYVCENDDDIRETIRGDFSLRDVFYNWDRGGTYRNLWYGYDANYPNNNYMGYKFWTYDESLKTIVQPVNTEDYSFFTSKATYDKYKIKIRCYSERIDDDAIGFIAAFAEDSSGRPHTLSFIRTTNWSQANLSTYHWFCAYDYATFNDWPIISTNVDVNFEGGGFWSYYKNAGTLIEVERDGNSLTARSCEFTNDISNLVIDRSSEHSLEYDITLNLETKDTINNPSFNKDKLDVFKGPCRIGFSTFSQPNAKYELYDVILPKIIIDARTNKISSVYNNEVEIVAGDGTTYVGIGRLTKNISTKKTFYTTSTGFVKISEYKE